MRGSIEVCERAEEIVDSVQGKSVVDELKALWEILEDYGCTENVRLDLNMVSHMSYYTGILFEVYAESVGFVIGSGGRYNKLLGHFNSPAPATGFGLRIDRMIEALHMKDEPSEIDAVIFSKEQRVQAIAFANEERLKGKKLFFRIYWGLKILIR